MRHCLMLMTAVVFVLPACCTRAADIPAEWLAASEKRRADIPLGGDFRPDPKVPVIVSVGHGARILLSRDDGKSWQQVFWGYPGSDHGGWATSAVAWTNGVFAVPVGWTNPTSYLASEDGVNWRHLSNGATQLPAKGDGKAVMPTTISMAGGQGVFVGSGYMTFTVTPDFGKSFSTFSLRTFKDDPRWPLKTHHVKTLYLGDASGRFLAVGDDRSTVNPGLCRLFASDDLGRTWSWIDPKGLKRTGAKGEMLVNNNTILLTDRGGENAFRSHDGGETWDGPHITGARRAELSVVNGEFWLVSDSGSRSSADGSTWHDLPKSIPAGKIVVSQQGALIAISKRRHNILRSTDRGKTWDEVYRYHPETEYVRGAQGLRAIAVGYVTPAPVK